MTNHSFGRLLRIFWILACLALPADAAQYILEIAPGADISQITARYGLSLVRPLSQEGPNVYLVAVPDPPSPLLRSQLLADSSILEVESERDVVSPETPPAAPVIANTAAL